MRAGTLTELITILAPKVVINEVGEQTTEYIDKCRTRAKVDYNSGNRTIENTEIVFNYIKTFHVRYYINVDESDRILWNRKQYRITSIEPNKQYQEKIIIAEVIND